MPFHWVFHFTLVLLSDICSNYIHIYFEFWGQDWMIIKPTQAFEKEQHLYWFTQDSNTLSRVFPFFLSVHWVKIDWHLHQFPQNFVWRGTWGHLNSYRNPSYCQTWKTFTNFLFEMPSLGNFNLLISFSSITRVQWEGKTVSEVAWGTQVAKVMELLSSLPLKQIQGLILLSLKYVLEPSLPKKILIYTSRHNSQMSPWLIYADSCFYTVTDLSAVTTLQDDSFFHGPFRDSLL